MTRKRFVSGICAVIGMLFLILDSKTAITGAREGLELCIRTVIPSLFPFFVLSIALTSSLAAANIPLLRPLGRLCGIPPGSEAIVLTGFLGGYPVGAQAVAQVYSSGQLSYKQANRMLTFCNNAGPSFLFGIIAGCFPNMGYAWALWGLHIGSAVLTAIIMPAREQSPIRTETPNPICVQELMKRAITVMANVCGWVILFRVILAILSRWVFWALPSSLQVLMSGLLELTNGCCMLTQVSNIGLRFILCAGMLTFGGLCVAMQTCSVIGGLSTGYYFFGKVIQTVLCVGMAAIYQNFLPAEQCIPIPGAWIAVVVAGLLFAFTAKRQKNSSNPMTVGV